MNPSDLRNLHLRLRQEADKVLVGLAEPFELLVVALLTGCLLYTSPSPRDRTRSRMPSSA